MNRVVENGIYKSYIIFDIDGTLANIKHRLHFIKHSNGYHTKPDWDAFNNAMTNDDVNQHIAEIYRRFCSTRHSGTNYGSIFVTGRPETHRRNTEQWLQNNNLIPTYLLMRPAKDYRSDIEIKAEIVGKYIKNTPIYFVVDDRDAVVEMWRNLGYKCLQVQRGDY